MNEVHGHELAINLEIEVSNLPSLFEAFTLWEVIDPYLISGMPFVDLDLCAPIPDHFPKTQTLSHSHKNTCILKSVKGLDTVKIYLISY